MLELSRDKSLACGRKLLNLNGYVLLARHNQFVGHARHNDTKRPDRSIQESGLQFREKDR